MTIAPIGSFSLSIGTAMYDRAPPSLAAGFETFSAEKSSIWIACLVWMAPEAARPPRLKSALPLIVFDKCCWHPELRHRANATARLAPDGSSDYVPVMRFETGFRRPAETNSDAE